MSDGRANLTRYMRYANVNPKQYIVGHIVDDPDYVAVEKGSVRVFVGQNNKEVWQILEDFRHSNATDKHVVVDYSTGALHFGNGIHGKIPVKGQAILVSYEVQRDGFIRISEKLKTTMYQIAKLEQQAKKAYVFSSYESPKFIKHMADLGKNDLYDGLTIHPYSGHIDGGEDVQNFYDEAMVKAEKAGIKHVENYVKMLPSGKVPVISEFGIFRNTEPQVRSLTHALYIAKTLMAYVKLGSPYIQKHALIDWYSAGADALGPTQQAVIQAVAQSGASTKTGKGGFKYFSTPSAHVFEMLNSGFGNYILASQVVDMPQLNNKMATISTLVSKDDEDNLYIALLNIDKERQYAIDLVLSNMNIEGHLVEVQVLTSDNIADENSLDMPNKVYIKQSTFIYHRGMPYHIQPHSFVLLKIKPAASIDI